GFSQKRIRVNVDGVPSGPDHADVNGGCRIRRALADAGAVVQPYGRVVNVLLFDVWQDVKQQRRIIRITISAGHRRQTSPGVVAVVQGQSHLLEVVLTFRPVGGFPHLLYGRQEQADQDGDNGNHHQQFDKRERFRFLPREHEIASHSVPPPKIKEL